MARSYKRKAQPEPRAWVLYWAPEGRPIATVQAPDERSARRKAPAPYRRFLGELYAVAA